MAKTVEKSATKEIPPGAIGTSLGTLYLLLISRMPELNVLKPWFVAAAPALSAGITLLVKKVNKYYDSKAIILLKRKFTEQASEMMSNPNISREKKEKIQKLLEEMEMANIEGLAEKIKRISVEIYK